MESPLTLYPFPPEGGREGAVHLFFLPLLVGIFGLTLYICPLRLIRTFWIPMTTITRTTTETDMTLTLDLHGSGRARIDAGIGFFDLQGVKT